MNGWYFGLGSALMSSMCTSVGNGAVIAGADVRLDFSRCSGGTPIECELRLRRN